MKKIAIFYRTIDIIALTSGLLLCHVIRVKLIESQSEFQLNYLLCLFVIIFIVRTFSYISSAAFKRFKFLRKMILYSDYIEGIWLSKNNSGDAAITNIHIDGQQVKITGEQYDNSCNLIWTWKSLVSGYESNSLMYISESRSATNGDIKEVLGITKITFLPYKSGVCPNQMEGYWSAIESSILTETFYSKKITKRREIKQFKTPEQKIRFLKNFHFNVDDSKGDGDN